MKVEFNSLRPAVSSSFLYSFDTQKFVKRLKSKEKIGWWQHYLKGIEERRKEIYQDLLMYKSKS